MIVSEARYRTITRDISTDACAVTGALIESQRLIEEFLHRPLERAETTETLPIYRLPDDGRGRVQPRRMPIVSTAGQSFERLSSAELIGVEPADFLNESPNLTASVTFTGGWLPYDDPTPDELLIPATLERAIAFVAQGMATRPVAVGVSSLAGVTSATVGDVSVTFGDAQAGELESFAPGVTESIEAYAYRSYV
jgi:hypothetical protein